MDQPRGTLPSDLHLDLKAIRIDTNRSDGLSHCGLQRVLVNAHQVMRVSVEPCDQVSCFFLLGGRGLNAHYL